MFQFEYTVTTKACPKLAWDVFSDWRQWHRFADVYGGIHWREGTPWKSGSRMDIEIIRPVPTVVSHVITDCVPGEKVGWIDQGLGLIMDQWVTFESHSPSLTHVHTWGKIAHSGGLIAGQRVDQLIRSFTRTWYENFRLACEHVAEQMAVSRD